MTNFHVIEKNFDSGFRGEYKGFHIDNRLISYPQINSPLFTKLSQYQANEFLNTHFMALEIFDSIIYLNKQIQKTYLMHAQKGIIENIYELNAEKENIIHTAKRIIDDLIMILCVFYDSKNIEITSKIEISSIGGLKNSTTDLASKIKSDLNYSKYELILNVINDLHNAYKHSSLMNSSHFQISIEGVSLTAYYAKYNKINQIEYHNHNLMHVVIAFSDFLSEFCNLEIPNRKYKINTNEDILKK